MGLASKLASAQQNPNYYGAPGAPGAPGGYPPQGQPGGYPPGPPQQQQGGQKAGAYQPQQYQPYSAGGAKPPGQPGATPYGAPQGQYGGQQPMGAPMGGPMGGQQMGGQPVNPSAYTSILQRTVTDNKLQSFYPPGSPKLDQIARSITNQIDTLCNNWHIPREIGMDFVQLALFDIVIYIDDSGSMAFEENGERIKDLKVILERVAFASTLFDADGISLRFMNNDFNQDNIKTGAQINQVVDQVSFRGLTPMGTSLRSKVVDPLIVQRARSNQLQKPVLVITITDGQPAGEPDGAVVDTVLYASNELSRTQYGAGAVSFQFAQVGNDLRARDFLSKLDKDPRVGHLIDCTSNFEVEADEMAKSSSSINFTPEIWLTKLLLGAIDSSYDKKDEQANQPQSQMGGPSQYGAPAGQYGAPAGQYGAPSPYGAPTPQGQYGAPTPQGQYGAPPPQGQYGAPPPQGQYGAPPPSQYGAPPPGQYGAPPQGQYGAPPPGQYGAPPGGYSSGYSKH